jgi:two-component system response regulator RegA
MDRPAPVNVHPSLEGLEDKTCLVMDDDGPFVQRLARALAQRGFIVSAVSTVLEGKDIARLNPPAFAVLDLRLEDGTGLEVVEMLQKVRPEARAVILTGYGAIATAVAAVKAGAVDYLSKPADVEDIIRALTATQDERPAPPDNPMSADRVRWEHIQRVYELCNHNVSETARRLNMHRRTLQRILAKRAPR